MKPLLLDEDERWCIIHGQGMLIMGNIAELKLAWWHFIRECHRELLKLFKL